MKTFKVSTSAGPYYVDGVSCGWVACQIAQQELGEDVEVYDAIEIGEYEEDKNEH
jgi:hypothetical protein